ncbi:ras-related protein Rab-26-like [Drosophila takahashii]|uniref:ras-related protein Rab-26-like n=1 Tax=Drosophila takahashii TaxID=29030 RepID=UPI00389929DC
MSYSIIFLGNTGVGKTSLISQCKLENLPWTTFPATEIKPEKKKNGLITEVVLWDTPGEKRFQSEVRRLCERIYKNDTYGAVLVYDIHNRESYEAAKQWATELKAMKEDNIREIVLIGNKVDIPGGRVVTKEEAEGYAKQHDLGFQEISAKTTQVQFYQDIVSKLFCDDITRCREMLKDFRSRNSE